MTTLTREQVRAKIDLLEALEGVMSALDDVSGVEFADGEQQTLDLGICDSSKKAVAFAHVLPPEVILYGLQAMRGWLEQRISTHNPNEE